MSNLTLFITGPLDNGPVVLMAYLSNDLYVLRPDPNPNFIPYFGQVNSDNNGNYKSLNLTVGTNNPPNYTLLAGNSGFVQTDADGLVTVAVGSGNFDYKFT